jgi:hypothetical protein
MRAIKVLVPILAVVLVLTCADAVLACPNCREAMANQNSPEAVGLRNGYFWSILLMISVPMSLLGTGAFMVVRAVKRGALPEM